MNAITLNVYDEKGKIAQTVTAEKIKLRFGAVRSIMELLNVENISDTTALLSTIYKAWDQLISILNKCFPEMNYEDWENVELAELIPAVIEILKYSLSEIHLIPKDPKN